jgi:hypothetical protein
MYSKQHKSELLLSHSFDKSDYSFEHPNNEIIYIVMRVMLHANQSKKKAFEFRFVTIGYQ